VALGYQLTGHKSPHYWHNLGTQTQRVRGSFPSPTPQFGPCNERIVRALGQPCQLPGARLLARGRCWSVHSWALKLTITSNYQAAAPSKLLTSVCQWV